MGVRPVVSIDVDDSKFQRFLKLFESYSNELDAQPEAWKKLGDAMGESSKGLEASALTTRGALALAAAQAGIVAEALREAVDAQHDLGRATNHSAGHMNKLKKGAEGVKSAISAIGGWVVRIGAIGGLGALFSGVGIGDLASAAFSRTRAAGQLGLSPGALASFQVHAQQFLGTSALEAAANAQIDVSKAGYLAALGIGYNAATKMSASDLAFEELKRVRAAYIETQKRGGSPMQSPAITSYLALGGSLGDIRNAALQPLSAINAAQARTRADARSLGFSNESARAWTQLKITLDKAGFTIQNALIDRLAPLAPKIEILAKDVAQFITFFVNSKNFDLAINAVKTGLQGLSNFLEKTDWKSLGQEIGAIVEKFKWLIPRQPTEEQSKRWAKEDQEKRERLRAIWNAPGNAFHWAKNQWSHVSNFLNGAASKNALDVTKKIVSVAAQMGVDPILALATAMNESGLNPKAVGDKGTSFGLFQLHKGGELGNLSQHQAFDAITNTKRALSEFVRVARAHPGLSPGEIAARAQRPADPATYAKNVNSIYDQISKKIMSDMISVVDADIKKHGKSWAHYLPKDAAAFVASAHLSARERTSTDIPAINKALKAIITRRAPKPAHVSITNNTSARVAISVNAAVGA